MSPKTVINSPSFLDDSFDVEFDYVTRECILIWENENNIQKVYLNMRESAIVMSEIANAFKKITLDE